MTSKKQLINIAKIRINDAEKKMNENWNKYCLTRLEEHYKSYKRAKNKVIRLVEDLTELEYSN